MMMTGATMRHGLIVGNLFELLRARLDRKQWVVLTDFGIDVRPGTVRYRRYRGRSVRGKGRRIDCKSSAACCGSPHAVNDEDRPGRQGS